MSILDRRQENADLVLKGRFIRKVLDEQSQSIDKAQTNIMNKGGFSTPELFSRRSFQTEDEQMTMKVLTVHRFIDMKSRKTETGVIRKKSHPIYNRIIFGHIPNIVRQLSYGYTDAIIEEMKKLED